MNTFCVQKKKWLENYSTLGRKPCVAARWAAVLPPAILWTQLWAPPPEKMVEVVDKLKSRQYSDVMPCMRKNQIVLYEPYFALSWRSRGVEFKTAEFSFSF